MVKVLVVDDEPNIVRILSGYLEQDGFEVLTALDGDAALRLAKQAHPDLVVLDLMLPGRDGIEICQELRRDSDVPVLMLTARSDDADKLVGLAVGADDYVTKPFNPREIVARIKAILRRTDGRASRPVLRVGALKIDTDARAVYKEGQELAVTALEFDLLAVLAERSGRVWSRRQLLERCWADQYYGDERVVDVHVANLRKKIEDDPGDPKLLKTARGAGYKLVGP